jgi:hypothetical protein
MSGYGKQFWRPLQTVARQRPGVLAPMSWIATGGIRTPMRKLALLVAALLICVQLPARADVVIISDPDKWIEEALRDISEGRTDDFARN